jgi:hypothetical protein
MKTTPILAISAAALAVSAASAANVNVAFTGTGAGSNVRLTVGSATMNVFAGQLMHTISGATGAESWINGSKATYCADLTQYVTSSTTTFVTTDVANLRIGSPMGTVKANAIRDMFAFAAGSQIATPGNSDFTTAMQLAVWEVINDYNAGAANKGLSVTSGTFSATKTDGSALSAGIVTNLNALFAVAGTNVPGASGMQFLGLGSDCQQDQIVSGVVPTPGMLSMAAAGSLIAIRRRRSV